MDSKTNFLRRTAYTKAERLKITKSTELRTEDQIYLLDKWDSLCHRETINTSEQVFLQKVNGSFFLATRERIGADRYHGSKGGYWAIQYGNCRCWYFAKSPVGDYYVSTTNKYYKSVIFTPECETVKIPSQVHTKAEVLALAKELKFNI